MAIGHAGRKRFVFMLMCLLTPATASAQQATAELNGRVTDTSGAVLPGVTVTATQTATGLERTAVTDGSGAYLITNLPPGPYRLEVALQGFRSYVQTGVVLTVGATPTINASLAGGVRISVGGGFETGVAYVLDGADHNNQQENINYALPFPDALQEFRVATSGLTAQNGVKSGASVNAVTKSGTNSFHGNVFEFLRD